ncbi:uncharacterized protein RCO7_14166 [Rhynchosporium graminicola]|uniref:Uncharacterized protein n=2 Tax=Rhynchosporium TaxID=38037 RepID=A0A1E1M3A6_RHYSE|nr:uncharacterized protein RCO7_14166 [Rhynchosporium commune]CZT43065.1 uncharacterized protein RSE6_03045 [Rhynchosporium secalis]
MFDIQAQQPCSELGVVMHDFDKVTPNWGKSSISIPSFTDFLQWHCPDWEAQMYRVHFVSAKVARICGSDRIFYNPRSVRQ